MMLLCSIEFSSASIIGYSILMEDMIHSFCRKISKSKQFLKTGLLIAVLLLGVENGFVKGQSTCPTTAGSGSIGAKTTKDCAPTNAWVYGEFTLRFTSCLATKDKMVFDVDWGDGTPMVKGIKPTNIDPVSGYTDRFVFKFNDVANVDTKYSHNYPIRILACSFKVTVYIRVDGETDAVGSADYPITIYHQTDNYNGAKQLVLEEPGTHRIIVPVCVGQEICIQFQDVSELNCNQSGTVQYLKNEEPRYLQFEYGVGSGASTIPNVSVVGAGADKTVITNSAGVKTGSRLDGGNTMTNNTYYTVNNPGPSTNRLTNQICVGKTVEADTGKMFYVTLYNWNKCNPWVSRDPSLAGSPPPTAADRGVAVTTEAIIIIVPAPPKPIDATYAYCHKNHYSPFDNSIYTQKVKHDPEKMKPGYYKWYSNAACTNLIFTSDLCRFNAATDYARDFNPVTNPNNAIYRLKPDVPDEYNYWVTYQFKDENNPDNPLCESPAAKVTYIVREDISEPLKSQSLQGCAQTNITIFADGNGGNDLMTYQFGGDIEYVWTFEDSRLTEVSRTDKSITVKLNNNPAAPNTSSANISVQRKWKTDVTVGPCNTADCKRCINPKTTLNVTINPLPIATISGGAEVCADEKVTLTIGSIYGKGDNNKFDITISGLAPITNRTFTSSPPPNKAPYSFTQEVNPADGTVTDYKITYLRDISTGCVNTGIASTTTVTKRKELKLTSITGPTPVCENNPYPYTVTDGAALPQGFTGSTATRNTTYVWTLDGANKATGTSASQSIGVEGANYTTTPPSPKTKTIAVTWQYTTPTTAGKNCSSTKPLSIIVNPKPTVKINALTPNQTVCLGDDTFIDVDLTGVPGVDWVVEWSAGSSGNKFTTVTRTNNGIKTGGRIPIDHSYISPAGNYTFTVISVSQEANPAITPCSSLASNPKTAPIKVLKTPKAEITGGPYGVCNGMGVEIPVTGWTGENTGVFYIEYKVGAQTRYTHFRYNIPAATRKLIIPASDITQATGGPGSTASTTVTIMEVTERTKNLRGDSIDCLYNTQTSVTIISEQPQSAVTAGPDRAYCDPSSSLTPHQLVGSAPGGSNTGEWTVVSLPATSTLSNWTSSNNNAIFTPDVTGIYVLRWTVTGGGNCSVMSDDVTLSWGVTPKQAKIEPDEGICGMGPHTMKGNQPTPNVEVGRWKQMSGPGTATFADSTLFNTTVSVDKYGLYKFRWMLRSGACTPTWAIVEIPFKDVPNMTTPVKIPDACSEAPFSMALGTTNGPPWAFPGGTVTYAFRSNPSWAIINGNNLEGTAPANNGTAISSPYQIVVYATYNGCPGNDATYNLSVKPKPELTNIGNPELCYGDKVTFSLVRSLDKQVTYAWTADNADVGIGTSPKTGVAPNYTYEFPVASNTTSAPLVTHVTNLTATVDQCVSDPLDVTITVNPTPDISPIGNEDLCPSDKYQGTQFSTVNGLSNVTWTWSYVGDAVGLPGAAGNQNMENQVPDFTAAGNPGSLDLTAVVTVRAVALSCDAAKSFTIRVHPKPSLNFPDDQIECPTETSPGIYGGTWDDIRFSTSNNLSNMRNYYWREINYQGRGVTKDSADIIGKVFGDNLSGSARTTIIRAAGKSKFGCVSDSIDVNLTIRPRPVITTPAPNVSLCPGATYGPTSFVPNTPGASISWTNNNTAIGLPASGTNPLPEFTARNSTGNSISGNITIRATKDNCHGPEITGTITVKPLPVVDNIPDMPVCPNDIVGPVPFTSTNVNVALRPLVTYNWTISGDPVGAPNGAANVTEMAQFTAATNDSDPGVVKTSTVTVQAFLDGCTSTAGNKSFAIRLKPSPKVTAFESSVLACPSESIDRIDFNVNISTSSSADVRWWIDNPGIANPPLPTNSQASTSSGNVPPFTTAVNNSSNGTNNTATIYYTATVDQCPSLSPPKTITITVKPTPSIVVPGPQSYCHNIDVNLPDFTTNMTGPIKDNVTYHWRKDTIRISTMATNLRPDDDGQIPNFHSENTSTDNMLSAVTSVFKVKAILNGCESARQPFTVTIQPVPQLAPYTDLEVCAGDAIQPLDFSMLPAVGASDVPSYSWTAYNTFSELRLASPPIPPGTPGAAFPSSGTGNLPDFIGDTSRTTYPGNVLWGNTPQKVSINVMPELNGCTGVTPQTVYITVNPLPITQIADNNSDCVTGKLNVLYQIETSKVNAGSKYYWDLETVSGNAYAPKKNPGQSDINYQVYLYDNPGYWKGYITAQETNSFGCKAPAAKLYVETIPAPIVEIDKVSPVCSGTTIQLNATVNGMDASQIPPNTYTISWFPPTWIDPVTERDNLDPHVTLYSDITKTVSMSLTVGEGNCKSLPVAVDMLVHPQPSVPLFIDKSYCSGEPKWKMDISNVDAGNTFTWNRIDGANTYLIGNTGNHTGNDSTSLMMNLLAGPNTLYHTDALPNTISYVNGKTVIYYSVTQTNSNGCVSAPAVASMTIRETPAAPVTSDVAYCQAPGQNVYALNVPGNNIRWYTVPGPPKPTDIKFTGETYNVSQANPGAYPYYVTQMDAYGNACESDKAPLVLTIHPQPVLSFDVSALKGCADFAMTATNTSNNNNVGYIWDWGDNTATSNAPQNTAVPHTYTNTSSYNETVTLTLTGTSTANQATSGAYCSNFITKTLTVFPKIIADFYIVPGDNGCTPFDVEFINASDKAATFHWYWDLATAPGKGQTGWNDTRPNPNHTFTNTNTNSSVNYRVWLQALGSNNECYSNKDVTITVNPAPSADFTIDNLRPDNSICSPTPVKFTNTSSGNPAGTNYSWDWGDNTSENNNSTSISHPYINNTGRSYSVNVLLTATNTFGCSGEKLGHLTVNPEVLAEFTVPDDGCSPYEVQFASQSLGATTYTWKFTGPSSVNMSATAAGGALTAPIRFENLSHSTVATINVELTTENRYGCSASVSHPMDVFPQPVASFAIDNVQGCQPLKVLFENTSVGNPTTNMSYLLDFGDASYKSIGNPHDTASHIYSNLSGQNTQVYPKLTATNEWGCIATFSNTITVYPYIKADFRMSEETGCAPLAVYLTNGSRGYSNFVWDFGDGSALESSQVNPTHVFDNPSLSQKVIYQVKLTVTAGFCEDSQVKTVEVYGNPKADFAANPQFQYYPDGPVTIENYIPLSDRNNLYYEWSIVQQGNIRDSIFSWLPDPAPLKIGKWGVFEVTQYVRILNGVCNDKLTQTVIIEAPMPTAEFDPVPPACMPYDVQFNNTSKNGKYYRWSFGDGATSTEKNPLHTYPDAGTYQVTLTVTGDSPYPSMSTRVIEVHPMPKSAFEVKPDFLWVGQSLRAFNYTSTTTSKGTPYKVWYKWEWGDGSQPDTIREPSHMYLKAGQYDITLTTGTYTDPQCVNVLTIPSAVELENAGDIILPNTFKPYTDGPPSDQITQGYQNYLFFPPVLSPTRKYYFCVVNRWGQLLFETTDPNTGWNGYFKGRLCDEGVYIYKIEGVFETGQSFSKMGDILLIR